MKERFNFTGDLATTAMGIMPHDSAAEALDAALGLDIPFWPQLPRVSYHEDMYVQAMENFPGLIIDEGNRHIHVDSARFMEDLPAYLDREESIETFRLSPDFSLVYGHFLSLELSRTPRRSPPTSTTPTRTTTTPPRRFRPESWTSP